MILETQSNSAATFAVNALAVFFLAIAFVF